MSLGECHAHTLVLAAESADGSDAANGARQLIELILAAQAAPGHYPLHETRSNLAFGFWYTLQVRFSILCLFEMDKFKISG